MSGLVTPHLVHYIAQECHWQASGELSVSWMLEAWQYAHRRRHRAPRMADVRKLGQLVEPFRNHHGFRVTGVRVLEDVKVKPAHLRVALEDLMFDVKLNAEASGLKWPESVAADVFKRYEDIHPFIDGNGRSGSLLYNWVRGSLSKPIHPPNLWNEKWRMVVGYPDPIVINTRRQACIGATPS